MFGLGRSKFAQPISQALGWDLHAHLVPGVDDGARTIDESVGSVLALKALGYTGCVVTPHVYKDLYDNSRDRLQEAFNKLRARIMSDGVSFGLRLSAEYFGDQHLIDLADQRALLSFGPDSERHILVEFPYISEPLYWADVLSALVRNGYQPVIAHPERYRYLAADPDGWLEKFGAYQVKYQYELGSPVGQYGKDAAKALRHLMQHQAPAFWGTDLHRASQAERFIRPSLSKLTGEGPVNADLDRLLSLNGSEPS